MLSSICTIPIEVLTRIFQQLVISLGDPELFRWYRACLSQAFVLRSVSAHFRSVTLGTPELWNGVAIYLSNRKSIGNSLSLLKHCLALAGNVNVSIIDALDEEEACLAINALLTSDTMSKIKAFQLVRSIEATPAWIKKLEGGSFPVLEELGVGYSMTPQNFDFGSLATVTRLNLDAASVQDTIIAPPSIRYLITSDISLYALVSLLYQCPDLVEFSAVIHSSWEGGMHFDEPLTLRHLKRMTFYGIDVATTPSSLRNLRLPSLETLEVTHHQSNEFFGFVLLCQNASATLTTLKIYVTSYAKLEKNDLYELFKLQFPKLRELELTSSGAISETAIGILKLRANECGGSGSWCFPSLRNFTVCCESVLRPHCLLVLLDQSRIGDVSYFHFEFKSLCHRLQDCSPELREELRSIVGSRQIEVIWDGDKILSLSRGARGLLQKAIMG